MLSCSRIELFSELFFSSRWLLLSVVVLSLERFAIFAAIICFGSMIHFQIVLRKTNDATIEEKITFTLIIIDNKRL